MADSRQLTPKSALVILMLGLISTTVGFWLILESRGFPNEISALATVTSSEFSSGGGRNSGGTHYAFEFTTPDGRQFTGQAFVQSAASVDRVGDTVTILYSKDAPEDARLWQTSNGVDYVPLVCGLLCVVSSLGYLIGFVRHRKPESIG